MSTIFLNAGRTHRRSNQASRPGCAGRSIAHSAFFTFTELLRPQTFSNQNPTAWPSRRGSLAA